jgi:multicomponent Na+:H+ antiporter subunit E
MLLNKQPKKASLENYAAHDNTMAPGESSPFWPALIFRTFLFGILWWVLTDDIKSLLSIGAPIILLAAWMSVKLLAPIPISFTGLVFFTGYFVGSSIRGAVEVAWFALHPQIPINPGMDKYKFHLPLESARVFMANCVSLLPGTLSADMNEEWLIVHILNKSDTFEVELEKMEKCVAHLFKIQLKKTDD